MTKRDIVKAAGSEPTIIQCGDFTAYRGARWDGESFGHMWWSTSEQHARGFGAVKVGTLHLDSIVVVDADAWESLRNTWGFEADEIIAELADQADAAAVVGWEGEGEVTFYLGSTATFTVDGMTREPRTWQEAELAASFGVSI